jgi:hypothetical protein
LQRDSRFPSEKKTQITQQIRQASPTPIIKKKKFEEIMKNRMNPRKSIILQMDKQHKSISELSPKSKIMALREISSGSIGNTKIILTSQHRQNSNFSNICKPPKSNLFLFDTETENKVIHIALNFSKHSKNIDSPPKFTLKVSFLIDNAKELHNNSQKYGSKWFLCPAAWNQAYKYFKAYFRKDKREHSWTKDEQLKTNLTLTRMVERMGRMKKKAGGFMEEIQVNDASKVDIADVFKRDVEEVMNG